MSHHRNSYRKTILFASIVASVALLFATALLVWSGWSIVSLLSLPCFAVAAFAGGVAAGGFIGMRRDELESRGQPYHSSQRREQRAGALSHLRRRLLTLMPGSPARLRLRPGEWVRVRPYAEIARTLDADGRLDGLPFMPEMLPYCGQRFQVFRRVEKIHDYFSPAGSHLRRMQDAVLLDELRCDGGRHGGCQAACQIIWKEAWLVPDGVAPVGALPAEPVSTLRLDAQTQAGMEEDQPRYVCQMTQLPHCTTPLGWSDPRHYWRDLWSGNVRLPLFLTAVALKLFNTVQKKTGGPVAPRRQAADGKPPASEPLDLRPGELVRVRSKREIEQTLNAGSKNKGLWFDIEMHRFCGGEFRVASCVRNIVDEGSGRMLSLRNPCIILEGVSATGEYLGLCPQNELIYWREVWLERVNAAPAPSPDSKARVLASSP
jgi:hypothetical protein